MSDVTQWCVGKIILYLISVDTANITGVGYANPRWVPITSYDLTLSAVPGWYSFMLIEGLRLSH